MKILILNGPNLNLLGKREQDIYGSGTETDLLDLLKNRFSQVEFSHLQSNVEGEIINCLQQSVGNHDAIILNAGGYSHTSVAIADCLAAIDIKVVEVHISNIHAREEIRSTSLTAKHCLGMITGFGFESYCLAAEYLINTH